KRAAKTSYITIKNNNYLPQLSITFLTRPYETNSFTMPRLGKSPSAKPNTAVQFDQRSVALSNRVNYRFRYCYISGGWSIPSGRNSSGKRNEYWICNRHRR